MTLHETYARVIAARPDAAVPALDYKELDYRPGSGFWWVRSGVRTIAEDEAEALILRHWIGVVCKDGRTISLTDGINMVFVSASSTAWYANPIEALAAYLIATAKEQPCSDNK